MVLPIQTRQRPVDQLSTGKQEERQIVFDLHQARYQKNSNGILLRSDRPVVAFDIDGVSANFDMAMYPFSNQTGEKSPRDYNYVTSGWFNSWEDFEEAHIKVMENASDIPLLDPTAPDAFNLLQENGAKVIIVTARREEWRDETLKFFHKHGMNINSQDLHIMDKKDKTSIHFDYIVDDAPKNIIDVLKNAPHAKPVIYNRRYNDHLPGDRVDNLAEFAEFVLNDL